MPNLLLLQEELSEHGYLQKASLQFCLFEIFLVINELS